MATPLHKKMSHQQLPDEVNSCIVGFLDMVEKAIPTMKVKSASASRAGNKVQVRVTWKQNEKTRVGYFSVNVTKTTKNTKFMRTNSTELVKQIFGSTSYVEKHNRSLWVNKDVVEELEAAISDQSFLDSIEPIRTEIIARMSAVIESGEHKSNAHKNAHMRASNGLKSILDYALRTGITDNEINDMVREALVRNVMVS